MHSFARTLRQLSRYALHSSAAALATASAVSFVSGGGVVATQPVTSPTASTRNTYTACPEVSCKSKEELAAMFSEYSGRKPRRISASTEASDGVATAAIVAAATPTKAAFDKRNCPLDREGLGNASWGLLHTMAAYYPETPSEEEKDAALGIVKALRYLYPCVHCRAQLQIDLDANPPRVDSRSDFALWMCEQHNAVNELIGRKKYDCSLAALDARWRTGRPECWMGDNQTAEESLGQATEESD